MQYFVPQFVVLLSAHEDISKNQSKWENPVLTIWQEIVSLSLLSSLSVTAERTFNSSTLTPKNSKFSEKIPQVNLVIIREWPQNTLKIALSDFENTNFRELKKSNISERLIFAKETFLSFSSLIYLTILVCKTKCSLISNF